MEEIWKVVIGYEGLYEVSNLGRVRSLDRYVNGRKGRGLQIKRGIILKPSNRSNKNKYLFVGLYDNVGKHLCKNIHVLVAKAFIPNPLNLPCVNHKDLNKSNPNADNLEWVTYSQNSKHAYENGMMPGSFKEGENGAKVRCTATGKIYTTIKQASVDAGISKKRLAHMVSGRCINKSTFVKI